MNDAVPEFAKISEKVGTSDVTLGQRWWYPAKGKPQEKRDCNFALYRERNLAERFWNKIKHYRGIATRYDKLARNFLAAVHLVSAIILLN
jgi:transposase